MDNPAIDMRHLDAIADADPYPYWYDDADELVLVIEHGSPFVLKVAIYALLGVVTPGYGPPSSQKSATRHATSF